MITFLSLMFDYAHCSAMWLYDDEALMALQSDWQSASHTIYGCHLGCFGGLVTKVYAGRFILDFGRGTRRWTSKRETLAWRFLPLVNGELD